MCPPVGFNFKQKNFSTTESVKHGDGSPFFVLHYFLKASKIELESNLG